MVEGLDEAAHRVSETLFEKLHRLRDELGCHRRPRGAMDAGEGDQNKGMGVAISRSVEGGAVVGYGEEPAAEAIIPVVLVDKVEGPIGELEMKRALIGRMLNASDGLS